MNIISYTIWILENHCFIVYSVLIAIFIAFTVFHKNRIESRELIREKKFVPKYYHAEKISDRENHDDEDPDFLTSAIPENTPYIPYKPIRRSTEEIINRSREYYELMATRRTVRSFSTEPIPQDVLDNIIKTAGTSPSGAHTEPWTFVAVQDPHMKLAIRHIVEEEEEENYARRMSRQWVTDLKPFATNSTKPYLCDAPALILVFRQTHSFRSDGKKRMHYYSDISVAIAAGILLSAIHYCGLVALTSTPLNCNSRLRDLLSRPHNERLELLLPVGKPHDNTTVPDLRRKPLSEIMLNC
ncbi:iodotyrosine deiodinase isoform X1 [Leptidea sinapis]|uniref:iodotyrosine deiodinase isoform X1 n=1 Tax=Leptidea sinapis TaxID=189913 RepID=UPI0021C2D8A6|nr:iodotyrosine deiodinase isoform X1 [Leptidea sinapis]